MAFPQGKFPQHAVKIVYLCLCAWRPSSLWDISKKRFCLGLGEVVISDLSLSPKGRGPGSLEWCLTFKHLLATEVKISSRWKQK